MPTTRHRKTRSFKGEGLTRNQKEHLIEGRNLLTVDFPFRNESHRKKLWLQHRASLIQEVGKDKRPAGFWDYETKERRKVVSGDESVADYSKGLSFGRAKIYNIESLADLPKYESQKAYLQRHKLYEET